jgi:ATP-binding cassette subfamily B protein
MRIGTHGFPFLKPPARIDSGPLSAALPFAHDMTPIPTGLTRFLWLCIKPLKWHALALACSALLCALLRNLAGPYFYKQIVDAVARLGDQSGMASALALPALFFLGMLLCESINFRMADWLMMRLFPAVRQHATLLLFGHLQRHSSSMFQDNYAGSLTNKLFDVSNGAVSVLEKIDQAVTICASLLIAVITMLIVHPAFAAILLIWGVVFIALSAGFLRTLNQLSLDYSEANSVLVGRVVDAITNIANIRLFARHRHEYGQLAQRVDINTEQDRSVRRKMAQMRLAQDVSLLAFTGAMLATLIHLAGQGKVGAGDFAMLLTVSFLCAQQLWFLADQFVPLNESWNKCRQGLATIATPHDIVDAPNAKPLTVNGGCIVFEAVSFSYQGRQRIFDGKNLMIEAGQKVGLVGASGSGKTTLANLLVRAFELDDGSIHIDGQDIAGVTLETLCRNIAVISQDTSLFHRSLMENIRYGRLDASDDEVMAAARLAHCDEFIAKLPQRYQTMVGDRGVKLSGGQRQRIAIARAILKDAPILVLGEATSALDTHTEHYVQQALQALLSKRTTIVIAHRLSTLAQMDRVLVFEHGRIVEDGTVTALLAADDSRFAAMWRMQAGGFLPDEVAG